MVDGIMLSHAYLKKARLAEFHCGDQFGLVVCSTVFGKGFTSAPPWA